MLAKMTASSVCLAVIVTLFLIPRNVAFTIRSKACPPGTFKQGKQCRLCPHGTYSDIEGATKCKPCPIGFDSPKFSTSKSDCEPCFPGTFAKDGRCAKCPPNTFSAKPASLTCEPCHEGTLSVSGAPGCTTCPVGTVASRKQKYVACELCPAGSSTFEQSSEECKPCPPGTFHTGRPRAVDRGLCVPCLPGMFADKPGSVRCKRCPVGSYQNEMGATSCIKCPPNSKTTRMGSEFCKPTCKESAPDCISCPPGQEFNAKDKKCVKCPSGYISSVRSSTPCYGCPPGESMVNKEQTRCDCRPGVRAKNNGKCQSCPYLFTSPDGSKCVCIIPLLPDGRCACPEGAFYSPEKEKCISPEGCPADTVLLGTKCVKCPADSFPDSSSRACTCGKRGFGVRNMNTKDAKCEICQPGEEPRGFGGGSKPLVTYCLPCREGEFSDKAGATKCKRCPKGQRPLKQGATSCLPPCPPGSGRPEGAPNDGDETCRCKRGFGTEGSGSTIECVKCGKNEIVFKDKCVCPSGEFTGPGNTGCKKCPENAFVGAKAKCKCSSCTVKNKATGKCERCPAGTEAESGKCIPCPPTMIRPEEGSCFCRECKPGHFSFKGIKCLPKCAKGYFRNDKEKCVSCRPGKIVVDRKCDVNIYLVYSEPAETATVYGQAHWHR